MLYDNLSIKLTELLGSQTIKSSLDIHYIAEKLGQVTSMKQVLLEKIMYEPNIDKLIDLSYD